MTFDVQTVVDLFEAVAVVALTIIGPTVFACLYAIAAWKKLRGVG